MDMNAGMVDPPPPTHTPTKENSTYPSPSTQPTLVTNTNYTELLNKTPMTTNYRSEGLPERDISSLGVMGWGLASVENSSAVVVVAAAVAPLGGWEYMAQGWEIYGSGLGDIWLRAR